jgi:hypothetical protein
MRKKHQPIGFEKDNKVVAMSTSTTKLATVLVFLLTIAMAS